MHVSYKFKFVDSDDDNLNKCKIKEKYFLCTKSTCTGSVEKEGMHSGSKVK